MAKRSKRAPKVNGRVLYHGPSAYDGAEIVCILTGLASDSSNSKTGAMLQTYILRADEPPPVAKRRGADTSVCGDCKHRSVASGGLGSCYVNVGQGPNSVWRAWRRGRYPAASLAEACDAIRAHGAKLRIGSYGDPAAVPIDWRQLAASAPDHTGYTHAWHRPQGATLVGVCMASADSLTEAADAQASGWSTFRVAPIDEPARVRGEARCPASAEAGKRVTCATCPIACNGSRGAIVGRVILAHGATRRRFRV